MSREERISELRKAKQLLEQAGAEAKRIAECDSAAEPIVQAIDSAIASTGTILAEIERQ